MEVTLLISAKTVRKIRALNILREGQLGGTIEEVLAGLVDRAVSLELANELDLDVAPSPAFDGGLEKGASVYAPPPPRTPPSVMPPPPASDVTGISDGLGDDDDGHIDGGLTDEAIEKDMEVDDPDHEGKAEAPSFQEQMSSAEETFANIAGVPTPPPAPILDARAAKRKRRNTGRGKAVPFTGVEESRI